MLDGVDSLFEGQAGEAKDLLVELLSQLLSFNGRLHLLMTSEQSVLRDTSRRLRNGAEQVREVEGGGDGGEGGGRGGGGHVNQFRVRWFRTDLLVPSTLRPSHFFV